MTTIILLVSRFDNLQLIFTNLEMLECDQQETNLLVAVDGDAKLYVETRNRTESSKFTQRLCVQYQTNDKLKNYDIGHRRRRIANIHNFLKQHIWQTDYIFGIEDDTTFSTKALLQLHKDYANLPYAGMIQGYQIGRWGINHYGSWTVDDIYEPTEITSQPKGEGLKECDTGGLYCFLTKANHYLNHDFKPFGNNDLGPDFDFGLSLRQQGLMNYTDWTIPCDHLTKNGIISADSETQQIKLIKTGERFRQKSL